MAFYTYPIKELIMRKTRGCVDMILLNEIAEEYGVKLQGGKEFPNMPWIDIKEVTENLERSLLYEGFGLRNI